MNWNFSKFDFFLNYQEFWIFYDYYSAKSGAGGGPNGGAAVSPAASSSGYDKANGSIGSGSAKYYNGKNAANTDAIGYNNGNGYVKIKAGWKADYA